MPFAPESALSGVGRAVAADQRLWYRRTFQVPPAWRGQRVWLRFDAPQPAVTPGQAAVFYDGDEVLGGGFIVQPQDV